MKNKKHKFMGNKKTKLNSCVTEQLLTDELNYYIKCWEIDNAPQTLDSYQDTFKKLERHKEKCEKCADAS